MESVHKLHKFGQSTDWESVTGKTALKFQGHDQFWVGAGNGTWYTGTGNARTPETGLIGTKTAHDLLITTMQSQSGTDRGITFAVATNGNMNAGYRLGKWHSGTTGGTSLFAIDGQLYAKGGHPDSLDFYSGSEASYGAGIANWVGDGSWVKPSIVSSMALQINAGSSTTSTIKPTLQFHQFGYGGVDIHYDGPAKRMQIGQPSTAHRVDAVRVKTHHGYLDIGPSNTSYAHLSTDRPSFYFNKKLVVDEGIVQSHDEDLILRRTTSGTQRLRITAGTTHSDQNFSVAGVLSVSQNIIAGSTTKASDTVIRALSNDSFKAGFEAYGNNQGTGYLYVGQEASHGGGVSYNGDGTPVYVPGERADEVLFYRRVGGVNHPVFGYMYNENAVLFRGNITAPSFIGALSGNASTATALQTARTIGGVSFNGTANINLPGVNTAGNQSTSGNAATATRLQTARTINGVSFNGTANITVADSTKLPLTGGELSGELRFPNGNVVNRPFNMIENANPQWILLCRNAGANNVNGSIYISRTSGHHQAAIIEILVSSRAANMIGGVIKTSQVIESSEDYRLVTVTHGGLSYVAIKYTGIPYPSTGPAYFTGKIESTGSSLSVVSSGISNEAPFKGGEESYSSSSLTRYDGAVHATGFNGPLIGNASTATALQTARTIGGVSFNGTANINLPGVNTAGNQSTSGNAATATRLRTARTINGTSFNGSANITTATWGTARTFTVGNTAKSVNGSANMTWTQAEIGYTAADVRAKLLTVDGSGSGVDADLWDGQQFASYLNQGVRTGDSPTFSNVTATNNANAARVVSPKHTVGTATDGFDIVYNATTKSLDFNFLG